MLHRLAQRRELDRPLSSAEADDPFAAQAAEVGELSSRLVETRAELERERARADKAEQALLALQLAKEKSVRELCADAEGPDGPYAGGTHRTVRELVEDNTQLRGHAAALEEQLIQAKLDLALCQEELERRSL